MKNTEYLYLHPNQENPTSVRLQIKQLGIQQYFPFKSMGGEKQAWNYAMETRDMLKDRLKVKHMREELDFNKLFTPDGFIKNLGIHKRLRYGKQLFSLVVVIHRNHKVALRTERRVNEDTFDKAFDEITDVILTYHKIKPEHEIRHQLKKTRLKYLRKFHKLKNIAKTEIA